MRFTVAAALVAAIVIWSADAPGQEPAQTAFDESIEITEVLLDVLVTDTGGRVVLGLGPDDFVVEETEGPVELSSVAFYSNRFLLPDGETREVQHPGEVLADRHFVFLFDDVKDLVPDQQPYVRRLFDAARKSQQWIREDMLPGDWVAVASYDFKLKIHQDFTRDRDALEAALEKAARGTEPPDSWPSREPGNDEATPSLTASLPEGKALRQATPRMEDAIRLLAEAMGQIPGRKNVILFSIGFGRDDGTAPYARPDHRYYTPMKEALNTHNVAVYTVDITPPSREHLQSEFLRGLALDSGGDYYQRAVSFLGPLNKIADENNGYYLLSYPGQHPVGESGYQEVTVKVKNPELQVRGRKGYLYGR